MSGVIPRGIPLRVVASVVLFNSFNGCTKLSITIFTDGCPFPRSISQWFFESNSDTVLTVPHIHWSLPACHTPYTCGAVNVVPAAAPLSGAVAISSLSVSVFFVSFWHDWIKSKAVNVIADKIAFPVFIKKVLLMNIFGTNK